MKKCLLATLFFIISLLGYSNRKLQITFDNSTIVDQTGNCNIIQSSGITFTTDRFGNPNSAASFDDGDYILGEATSLPINKSERTISLWVKLDDLEEAGVLFGYGYCEPYGSGFGIMLNQSCGAGYCGAKITGFSYGNDVQVPFNYPLDSWLHIVSVYDGTQMKLYGNGQLLSTKTKNITTLEGDGVFSMGNSKPYEDCQSITNLFEGFLDDVSVFDEALTQKQVEDLYHNEATGINENHSEKFTLYPNPVSNIVQFTNTSEIQKITILDALGKVMYTTKTIPQKMDLSEYNSGMYVLLVEDKNGRRNSKKFIKK